MNALRHWLQTCHQSRLRRVAARSPSPDTLRRSAIVFSPHQDDETLGCGGTIWRKRQAGAIVTIVFMTDGSESHSQFMSPQAMADRRTHEAIAAAQTLGVSPADVIFLALKDGQLSANQAIAIDKVTDLLNRYQPEEVYVPYRREPHPDHVATQTAVIAALQRYGQPTQVYEYPIWFWNTWPWTTLSVQGGWRDRLQALKQIPKNNWRFWRDFQVVVPIAEVLDRKRVALEHHESQVQRLIPDPNWTILADAANGDFLPWLLQEYEIFHTHRSPASRS